MRSIQRILSFALLLIAVVAVGTVVAPSVATMDLTGMSLAAAPLVIKFSKNLEQNLEPNNAFYANSINESEYVNGRTVIRPVSASDPVVLTNPTVFPLSQDEIVDDDNSYDIALHAVKPRRLGDREEMERNYNMRMNEVNAQGRVLRTKMAQEIVYNWSPSVAGQILPTSGGNVNSVIAGATTGLRKAVTLNDLIDAVTKLKGQDAGDDLYALIASGFYAQLLKIPEFVDYNKTGRADMLAKGIIGDILGVKIYERSIGGVYTAANAPKKLDAATAGTDQAAIIIWSANHVYRAQGGVNVYLKEKDPNNLGDVLNSSVAFGGNTRKDQKGVVSIVEATV